MKIRNVIKLLKTQINESYIEFFKKWIKITTKLLKLT